MAIGFGRLFDYLLSVGVVIACVLYGRAMWSDFGEPSRPPARQLPGPGTRVPALISHQYEDAEATILLFVKSSCRYCTESMPFYRSLLNEIAESRKEIRLVALGPEPAERLMAYLQGHGLTPILERADQARWSFVRGTPSILIVDRHGAAMASFVGRLGLADQDKLRRVLALR